MIQRSYSTLPWKLTFTFSLILLALMVSTTSAQLGGTSAQAGPSQDVLTQTAFSARWTAEIKGDYLAAGVGMRNIGSGNITISLPAGAEIVQAYLYFAYIDPAPVTFSGKLNNQSITPMAVGTSTTPCWGEETIHVFVADVTGIAVDGLNALTDFPSGLTNHALPQSDPRVAPLLEGATLVVVFRHPAYDYNLITLWDGASTFFFSTMSVPMGLFTAVGGNPMDQRAQTTFIVADGQYIFLSDGTAFNGTATSGPTTGIKTLDAFDGADGRIVVDDMNGLWDTHNLNVSSFFPLLASTPATPSVVAGAGGDCLTWCAQVLSVKTMLAAHVDIKPGSCPNPINVASNGNIPVAILGTQYFNASQIDPATIELHVGSPMATGVAPMNWNSLGDVATPQMTLVNDCYDCTTLTADGYADLRLRFNTQAVIAALPTNVTNGTCLPVYITGELFDGSPFRGRDMVRIIIGGNPKDVSDEPIVSNFGLTQNTPNPFGSATTLKYSLPSQTHARLAVYDVVGREVAVLLDQVMGEGDHTVRWNGRSTAGAQLPAGVYFCRLTAGTQSAMMRMVIAR